MQRFTVSGEGFRPQDAPGTGAESLGELELNSPDGGRGLTGPTDPGRSRNVQMSVCARQVSVWQPSSKAPGFVLYYGRTTGGCAQAVRCGFDGPEQAEYDDGRVGGIYDDYLPPRKN